MRATFPSSEHRSKEILDLIHLNVCGPMLASLLGNIYNASFINDFFRKSWFYFMKMKGEVFKKFQVFKALVNNHTEKKIKGLKLNNGGEYTCKEFDTFSRQTGIKEELAVLDNPQ